MTLTTTALGPAVTTYSSSTPFNEFTNSFAGASISSTTGCGDYTYSLTSYTGNFLTLVSATRSLTLQSLAATDSGSSPYTVNLRGCLTLYNTLCYDKQLTVTINACVITTFALASGQVAIPPTTYRISDPALSITLPLYTQTPACGYTQTISCF